MKKAIASIIIMLVLAAPAFAVAPLVPLILLVDASLVWHTMGILGAIVYQEKTGPAGASKVTPTGSIKNPADVTWIDLTIPEPAQQHKALDANITMDQVKGIVEKDAASKLLYANLEAALNKPGGDGELMTGGHLNTTGNANSVYSYQGNSYKLNHSTHVVDGCSSCYSTCCTSNGLLESYPNGTALMIKKLTGYYGSDLYYFDRVATPPSVPATSNEFAKKLANSPSDITADSALSAAYEAEIDALMLDPAYVPVFTDATTGLPSTPPVGAASAAQIAAYNAGQGAKEAAATATASAAGAAGAAGAASTTAAAGAAAANAAAAAAPGDATLAAAAARANTAAANAAATAAAATAALDKLKAEQAKEDAKKEETTASAAAGLGPKGEKTALNLAPLNELKGVLDTTYPFNLPSSVAGYFGALSGGAGTAPAFDLPMPLGQTIHCDLSFFNPLAVMVRYMVGILTTTGILFYIIHFFRGIS